MLKKQYPTTTEEGFNIRLEARLKNAELIGAREILGLTATEVAKEIGISYIYYLNCESMRACPGEKTQKKICDFYRSSGVFLLEEDVFPEELKKLKQERKYTGKKTIPKIELLSISTGEFHRKLSPIVEGEVEKKVEHNELYVAIYEVLSNLPYRQQQVIKMRFGIDQEPKTFEEIGEIFKVTRGRIQQIEAKTLRKLSRYSSYNKKLKPFLKDINLFS